MNGTKRSVKRWVAIFLCFCIVISGINMGGFSGIFSPDGEVAHAASNYIYFDNGLAGYDKIEYSINDGADWEEMECLDTIKTSNPSDPRYISGENINPKYTYVTKEEVPSGSTITFCGTDSGTVYDTVGNYQISSGSREWGYDYQNFVWTTSDSILVDGSWDCYYAPALAMQYKYNNPRNPSELFIYNVGWALKNDDPDYYVRLTDALNYTVNGIRMPMTFMDSVNNVTYKVNGSDEAPIGFEKKEWKFTPSTPAGTGSLEPPTGNISAQGETVFASGETFLEQEEYQSTEQADPAADPDGESGSVNYDNQIAPMALVDPIDFTAQYTGMGDMITFMATNGGNVTIYANQMLTINGLDVTCTTCTDADNTNTLYEITATAVAGETYTIHSDEENTAIYSVQVGDSKLESITQPEDTTLAYDLTLTHGSQTVFTLPAETALAFDDTGACTSITPNGGVIGLDTTSTGQSKVSVTGGTSVKVTDNGGQPVSASTDASYKLEKGVYNITVDGVITDVNVGYRGTVTAKSGERKTYTISSNGDNSPLGKLVSSIGKSINEDTPVGPDNFFTLKASDTYKMSIAKKDSITSKDGKLTFKYRIETGGGIDSTSLNRSIAFQLEKGKKGTLKVYALSGGSDNRYLRLQNTTTGTKEEKLLEINTTTAINPITFDLSEPGSYYLGSAGQGIWIYYVSVEESSASAEKEYTFETFPVVIHPVNGENRTFTGYQYTMEGKTGYVTGVNEVGLNSQKDDAEGCPSRTGDNEMIVNDGISASTKTFDGATATIFDYFSDWELSGKKLEDHQYVYAQSNGNKDYKQEVERSSNTGESKDSDSPPTQPITFSENNNSISYTHQGDLWNQAIFENYKGQTSVKPLYFGANSWFTGNNRYMERNRYNDKLPDKDGYDENGVSKEELKEDNGTKTGRAYNIPEERTYLHRFLENDMTVFDASIGQSNSRGLAGLVQNQEVNGVAQLVGANSVTVNPLFDQNFIEGKNDKHAVYGKVYNDVAFRFKQNEATGYYEFDSSKTEYAVRLAHSGKKYYMQYTTDGTTDGLVTKADQDKEKGGQFYPFNSPATNESFSSENLMFGMKLSIPLVTYADKDRRNDLLKFSGDDDVWAYINTKDATGETKSTLAMDIGGTHAARGGVIDMKNGYAVTQSTFDTDLSKNYGLLDSDGKGNSNTSETRKLEEAAFAIATQNGVEIVDNKEIPPDVTFFGTTYNVADCTYTTQLVDQTGNINTDAPTYLKVTLKAGNSGKVEEVGNKNKTKDEENGNPLLDSNETATVNFAIYNLGSMLDPGSTKKDTLSYNIDIFYLERGLNSSNLKLAFRDVDISERAVEKQWTDSLKGFNLHNGTVGSDLENVKVDLYRESVEGSQEVLELVQENVQLDSGKNWYQYWNDLADKNSTDSPYTYYISPEKVTDNIENYTTEYYSVVDGGPPVLLSPETKEFNVKDPGGSDTTALEEKTLYPFAESTKRSTIRIVNTPKTDLELTKEWQLNVGVAGGADKQEPGTITMTVYRSELSKPGVDPGAPEKYGDIVFTPNKETDGTYNGTYTVTFKGVDITSQSDDGGKAGVENIGSGLKKITWHAVLKDVDLYKSDGTRYVYYVKEASLGSTLNGLETNYNPSKARNVGGDIGLIYPFDGNDAYNRDRHLTMTVQNTVPQPKLQLDISKTDSAVPAQPLADAEFTLYEKDTSTGGSGDYKQVDTPVKTDSGGHVSIPMGVFDGNKVYRLEETSAPVGYDLSKTVPIEFRFEKQGDGNLQVVIIAPAATGDYYNGSEFTYDSATKTWILKLTLANTLTSYVLPDSGGSGVSWMLLTGSILLAAALLLAVWRRRQSARS